MKHYEIKEAPLFQPCALVERYFVVWWICNKGEEGVEAGQKTILEMYSIFFFVCSFESFHYFFVYYIIALWSSQRLKRENQL